MVPLRPPKGFCCFQHSREGLRPKPASSNVHATDSSNVQLYISEFIYIKETEISGGGGRNMNTQWDVCLRHAMFQTACCDSTICTYIKENRKRTRGSCATLERIEGQQGFLAYFYTGIDLTAAAAGGCYV